MRRSKMSYPLPPHWPRRHGWVTFECSERKQSPYHCPAFVRWLNSFSRAGWQNSTDLGDKSNMNLPLHSPEAEARNPGWTRMAPSEEEFGLQMTTFFLSLHLLFIYIQISRKDAGLQIRGFSNDFTNWLASLKTLPPTTVPFLDPGGQGFRNWSSACSCSSRAVALNLPDTAAL
jgi:hypothetical protein